MALFEDVVLKYRELREKKKVIVERHKLELAPYNLGLEKLETFMGKEMLTQGSESVKTPHGTAYTTITTSVKILDRQRVLDYLNESQDNLSALDIRINTVAAEDYIEENEAPIPGTTVTRKRNIRVRK
jgi:hypothetical protein